MIRIKVEGKNIADIFRLQCVSQIRKCRDGFIIVSVRYKKKATDVWEDMFATNGDMIEVESESSETGAVIEPVPPMYKQKQERYVND